MDILSFHRKVIEEITALRGEIVTLQHGQCETNNLLRDLVALASPQYKLTAGFKPIDTKEKMSTTPTPLDSTTVGQLTVGFPAETQTTAAGVTSAFPFNPASIAWTLADTTLATFTVDPATGEATFTALKEGSTTGTVTDNDTKATTIYDLTVAPGVQPNTFALTVAFQPK